MKVLFLAFILLYHRLPPEPVLSNVEGPIACLHFDVSGIPETWKRRRAFEFASRLTAIC